MTLKPKALKHGDTIGIAASASPFVREEFLAGVKNLEAMGFRVFYRPDIFERKYYLAGSDERRFSELKELLLNPEIKAVFFARGGYGLLRILPYFKDLKLKTPKIILGYSDITSLLVHLYQKENWTVFYGPVVSKDLSLSLKGETKEALHSAITQTKPLGPFSFRETTCLRSGSCEGELTGGCLSLVVASLATPFEIETKNRILFLEDTNEKPYAVDRMLTQLLLAGKLEGVRGIVFGNFVNGGEPDHVVEAAADVLKDFKGPILSHFPAGHGPVKITLPFGVRARLDADKKKLEFLEAACM